MLDETQGEVEVTSRLSSRPARITSMVAAPVTVTGSTKEARSSSKTRSLVVVGFTSQGSPAGNDNVCHVTSFHPSVFYTRFVLDSRVTRVCWSFSTLS